MTTPCPTYLSPPPRRFTPVAVPVPSAPQPFVALPSPSPPGPDLALLDPRLGRPWMLEEIVTPSSVQNDEIISEEKRKKGSLLLLLARNKRARK